MLVIPSYLQRRGRLSGAAVGGPRPPRRREREPGAPTLTAEAPPRRPTPPACPWLQEPPTGHHCLLEGFEREEDFEVSFIVGKSLI